MKGIHPILNGAAIVALLGLCGCRTPSGSLASNPFLGPDRVPPPATRALAPGEATPYYPGEPAPTTQGNNAMPETDAATSGLAWMAPTNAKAGASIPAVSAPTTPSAPAFAATTPALNERAVTIPTDESALRFQPTTPVAPQPVVPTANQVAVVEKQTVAPTAYYEPVASTPSAGPAWQKPVVSPSTPVSVTIPAQNVAITAQPNSPWPAVPASPLQQPAFSTPQTAYLAPPSMDVNLRVVPSPAPEPGDYSSPRIRLPGYQLLQPDSSSDGFRPRSTMR